MSLCDFNNLEPIFSEHVAIECWNDNKCWNHVLSQSTDDKIAGYDGFDFNQIQNIHLFEAVNIPPEDHLHVPLNLHAIWLVHSHHPKEMPLVDREAFVQKWQFLSAEGGDWVHYLWTNCKSCIPETVAYFKTQGIDVASLYDSSLEPEALRLIEHYVSKKLFGVASDFTRIALLKDYGGLYSDLNYQFEYHPISEMQRYDFFAHTDPDEFYVDIYFLAANNHHPIIQEAYERMFVRLKSPFPWLEIFKKELGVQDYTRIMTYLPFNWACFNQFHTGGLQNFVFPLEHNAPCPEGVRTCYNNQPLWDNWETFLQEDDDAPKEVIEAMTHYAHQAICMETILGHDGDDGGSWYRF